MVNTQISHCSAFKSEMLGNLAFSGTDKGGILWLFFLQYILHMWVTM